VRRGDTYLTATTVDSTGSFTVSFTVPDDAVEGQHTLYFYDIRLLVGWDISFLHLNSA
jgi:hypothetical protein